MARRHATPPAESPPQNVRPGPCGRVLDAMAPDGEGRWAENLAWFRAFVLVHFAMRSFLTIPDPFAGVTGWLFDGSEVSPVPLWYEAVLWLSVVVGFGGGHRRFARWACRIAAALVMVQMLTPHTATGLPLTANHIWLEFLFLLVLSFLDDRCDGEDILLLTTARWMVAIMFFYTGLQKVLYGAYFDGQFLAYQVATDDRFANMFQFLIPAEEFARLRGLSSTTEGAGPFRVDSPLFIAMSNAVYLAEMLIPVLLLFARTRMWGALAGIALVLMIEFGAWEITFGIFMINLFLLFLPRAWNKRLFPVAIALYLPLVANHVGLVDWPFLKQVPA